MIVVKSLDYAFIYHKVYDITYDNNGYPHFLIYENGEWKRVSAKHYRPLTKDEEALNHYV